MDLILETAPAVTIGARTVVGVTGGTFEGPKLKGKVVGPGADWPMRVSDTLRILDVRTILVTDDDQKIYMTYRGVIRMPPAGQQGERYWRTTPIFETDSKKYEWMTQIVAVGVSFTMPQRVCLQDFRDRLEQTHTGTEDHGDRGCHGRDLVPCPRVRPVTR